MASRSESASSVQTTSAIDRAALLRRHGEQFAPPSHPPALAQFFGGHEARTWMSSKVTSSSRRPTRESVASLADTESGMGSQWLRVGGLSWFAPYAASVSLVLSFTPLSIVSPPTSDSARWECLAEGRTLLGPATSKAVGQLLARAYPHFDLHIFQNMEPGSGTFHLVAPRHRILHAPAARPAPHALWGRGSTPRRQSRKQTPGRRPRAQKQS